MKVKYKNSEYKQVEYNVCEWFFLHLYGKGNLTGKIYRLNEVLIEYFELFKAN